MSLNDLELLAARRWKVAITLTTVMVSAYFGFILLIAFDKPLMGTLVFGGSISIGVVLGALVIVLAPVLTGIYVRWTNQHYDHAMAAIGDVRDRAAAAATAAAAGLNAGAVGALARARTPLPVPGGDAAPGAAGNSPAKPRSEVRS